MPDQPPAGRDQTAPRARLFEYLRHDQIGARAERTLSIERMTRIDGQAAAQHLALALRSWQRPQPVLRAGSAAVARRHHEFFRAVRP